MGKGGRPKLRRSARSANPKVRSSSSFLGDSERPSVTSGTGHQLKWSLQSERILKELSELFYCREETQDLTDVTLYSSEGEGDCVQAHKIVLMLGSPYFQKLFQKVSRSQKKERDNTVVVLGDVKASHLRNLVCFLYTGEITVSSAEEKAEFVKIAKKFGIEGVSPTGQQPAASSSSVVVVSPIKKQEGKPLKKTTSKVCASVLQELEDANNEGDFDKNDGETEAINTENNNPVTCKAEPLFEYNPMSDVDFDDMSGPADNADACSNFSDDLNQNLDSEEDDTVNDPDVSFKETRPHGRPISDANWIPSDPVSEENIKSHWRKRVTSNGLYHTSTIYYCYHNRRECPAALKIRKNQDGTTSYFQGPEEHANHRDDRLSPEQKDLVQKCLDSGIVSAVPILLKMEATKINPPGSKELRNYLAQLRLKPEMRKYWENKKQPEWKMPERAYIKDPDFGRGYGGGDEKNDDAGSNFSDELKESGSSEDEEDDDEAKKPKKMEVKGKKKGRPSLKREEPQKGGEEEDKSQLNWRTGKLHGWKKLDDFSEAELLRDWRVWKTQKGKSRCSTVYYCAYGLTKCPALVKSNTLVDGTEIFFRNVYPHENHRDPDHCFGMTKAQKDFVIECIQLGVTKPSTILLKMDAYGIHKPDRSQLVNWLSRQRKNPDWSMCFTKTEPKWPRRIRKKPEREGPPKKRGRPTKTSGEGGSDTGNNAESGSTSREAQMSSSSLSSQQLATTGAGTEEKYSPNLPPHQFPLGGLQAHHPNHFPLQMFPVNPPPPPPAHHQPSTSSSSLDSYRQQ